MNCPQCGAPNKDSNKFCENCGASLARYSAGNEKVLQAAAATGLALGAQARQRRMEADYSDAAIISTRLYNLIMAAVVLWGLLVNFVICLYADISILRTNPLLFLIIYIVLCILGVKLAAGSSNPWVSFLGYNLIVLPLGFLVAYSVRFYLGVNPAVVTKALLNTLLITAGMTVAALVFPNLFEKIGGMLLGILTGLVLCELVMLLLGASLGLIDILVAGLFSLYIGFDIHRSQQFEKTADNAVDCALDLYLDIINLFVRLLRIFARNDN